MKRYLILSDGMSLHTLKWAKELKNYFDLYFISFSSFRKEFYHLFTSDRLFEFNVDIRMSGGNYKILSQAPNIVKIIHSINPDVINGHYVTSYGFVCALIKKYYKSNLKIILSAWGSDILVTPKKNRFYFELTKFSLKKADIVTSDSYFMSDEIKRISNNYSITFPFGVEFLPNVKINDKDENLYFSNRALAKNYNIDKVIIFFSKIFKYNSDARLIIANDGPERKELMTLCNKLGLEKNIEFVGFLSSDEQCEKYRRAQYFISIPQSDSTSVSLLEAMSYGCVPIVSDLPSNREWVINNLNGFYIDDGKKNFLEWNFDSADILKINQKIISENAMWSNNILNFVNQVNKLI